MSLAHELKMQRLKGYWTVRTSRKQHLKKNAKSIVTLLILISGIFIIIPIKFYFYMLKWFDSFFSTTEYVVELLHAGAPNIYLGWLLFVIVTNLFFIREIIKNLKKPMNCTKPQVYPTW